MSADALDGPPGCKSLGLPTKLVGEAAGVDGAPFTHDRPVKVNRTTHTPT